MQNEEGQRMNRIKGKTHDRKLAEVTKALEKTAISAIAKKHDVLEGSCRISNIQWYVSLIFKRQYVIVDEWKTLLTRAALIYPLLGSLSNWRTVFDAISRQIIRFCDSYLTDWDRYYTSLGREEFYSGYSTAVELSKSYTTFETFLKKGDLLLEADGPTQLNETIDVLFKTGEQMCELAKKFLIDLATFEVDDRFRRERAPTPYVPGLSHHGKEDLHCIRTLPGMDTYLPLVTLISPEDVDSMDISIKYGNISKMVAKNIHRSACDKGMIHHYFDAVDLDFKYRTGFYTDEKIVTIILSTTLTSERSDDPVYAQTLLYQMEDGRLILEVPTLNSLIRGGVSVTPLFATKDEILHTLGEFLLPLFEYYEAFPGATWFGTLAHEQLLKTERDDRELFGTSLKKELEKISVEASKAVVEMEEYAREVVASWDKHGPFKIKRREAAGTVFLATWDSFGIDNVSTSINRLPQYYFRIIHLISQGVYTANGERILPGTDRFLAHESILYSCCICGTIYDRSIGMKLCLGFHSAVTRLKNKNVEPRNNKRREQCIRTFDEMDEHNKKYVKRSGPTPKMTKSMFSKSLIGKTKSEPPRKNVRPAKAEWNPMSTFNMRVPMDV